METMGVSYEASNNRKQSMDNHHECHDVVCQRHFTDWIWITDRLNHSESNFDLHKHE